MEVIPGVIQSASNHRSPIRGLGGIPQAAFCYTVAGLDSDSLVMEIRILYHPYKLKFIVSKFVFNTLRHNNPINDFHS